MLRNAFDAYKPGPAGVVPEVWIAQRDGGELKRLTGGATPRWSPDGKRILFMRERRVDADDKGPFGVFTIDRDGMNERRLCEGRWPEWSPDGSQIAFGAGESDRMGGTQQFSHIWVADADGTDAYPIANGDCPSWSPDGQKIACSYNDPALGAPMVRIIDLETGRQRFLGYGWLRPNWAGDSRSIVVNGVNDARRAAPMRLSATGEADNEQLTEMPGASSPCVSSDGKLLVFAAPYPSGLDTEKPLP